MTRIERRQRRHELFRDCRWRHQWRKVNKSRVTGRITGTEMVNRQRTVSDTILELNVAYLRAQIIEPLSDFSCLTEEMRNFKFIKVFDERSASAYDVYSMGKRVGHVFKHNDRCWKGKSLGWPFGLRRDYPSRQVAALHLTELALRANYIR